MVNVILNSTDIELNSTDIEVSSGIYFQFMIIVTFISRMPSIMPYLFATSDLDIYYL